jgi:hypothetical protein
VGSIEQPISGLALPVDSKRHSGIERRNDSSKGVDADPTGSATLVPCDQGL